MREIKFRAWIDDYKKYIVVQNMTDCENGTMHYFRDEVTSGYYDLDNPLNALEQFTGLHDENGKEIYEGDIVEIEEMPASPDTVEYTSLVVFLHGSFIVQCDGHVPMCAFQYRCPNGYAPMKLEVIGNIHQNPELLNNE